MEKMEILERYRGMLELLENMNCGFVVRDSKGIVTSVNNRCLHWLGYFREEIEGRPLIDFVPDEIREVNLVAMQATEEGDMRARLTTLQRKDGSTFPILVLATRFFDRNDEYAGSCSMMIELATVQTAKNLAPPSDLNSTLQRIAIELRAIAGSSDLAPPPIEFEREELAEISVREREVLRHLVDGDRVASIAKKLHISPHTVRNHLKSMYRKLGVPSQSELIEYIRGLPN